MEKKETCNSFSLRTLFPETQSLWLIRGIHKRNGTMNFMGQIVNRESQGYDITSLTCNCKALILIIKKN